MRVETAIRRPYISERKVAAKKETDNVASRKGPMAVMKPQPLVRMDDRKGAGWSPPARALYGKPRG